MYPTTVILALFTLTQAPEPVIGPDQFLRLIQGVQADYKDVSFVFEGTNTSIRPRALLGRSEEVVLSHQGYFAYRSDGAFLRDSYFRFLEDNDEGAILRATVAALGDRMLRIDYTLGHRSTKPTVGKPAPAILRDVSSPGRILWLWYFQHLEGPAGLHYEFQGWEEVDGHRCLRVQLDRRRGSERWKYRFWIDLERGGHPLRVDQVRDGEVWLRTDRIKLMLLPTDDGKELWLPVEGRTQQLVNTSLEPVNRPTMRDDCSIAYGTARINSGLGDAVFSIDWEGDLPTTPELSEFRKKADEPFVFRSDPESVRKELDRMLTEADAQAERLEASSATRRPWRVSSLIQLGFAALGVLLLGGVAIRKRMGR